VLSKKALYKSNIRRYSIGPGRIALAFFGKEKLAKSELLTSPFSSEPLTFYFIFKNCKLRPFLFSKTAFCACFYFPELLTAPVFISQNF